MSQTLFIQILTVVDENNHEYFSNLQMIFCNFFVCFIEIIMKYSLALLGCYKECANVEKNVASSL